MGDNAFFPVPGPVFFAFFRTMVGCVLNIGPRRSNRRNCPVPVASATVPSLEEPEPEDLFADVKLVAFRRGFFVTICHPLASVLTPESLMTHRICRDCITWLVSNVFNFQSNWYRSRNATGSLIADFIQARNALGSY